MTYTAYVQKNDRSIRLTDSEMDDETEGYLNGILPVVEILGMQYQAGAVLREVDPTAFREQRERLIAYEYEAHEFEERETFERFLEIVLVSYPAA